MLAISKALAGGLVALLTPIAAYLATKDQWSWRAFAEAVIQGFLAFFVIYGTPTDPAALSAPYRPRHGEKQP